MDLEFSESSSDDEDFLPENDTEASQTSEDELSELFSDAASDIRSPFVAHTPHSTAGDNSCSTPVLQIIDEDRPMVDMQQLTPNQKIDLISSRTRSRHPMPNIQVEELEALFNPPDFEPTPAVAPEDLDDDELIWQGNIGQSSS